MVMNEGNMVILSLVYILNVNNILHRKKNQTIKAYVQKYLWEDVQNL